MELPSPGCEVSMAGKAEPEEEPEDGPQVTSRLGPVRAGDGRSLA